MRNQKKMAKLFFTLIMLVTVALSNSFAVADDGGGYTQLDEAGSNSLAVCLPWYIFRSNRFTLEWEQSSEDSPGYCQAETMK